jgi:hypothetical protein
VLPLSLSLWTFTIPAAAGTLLLALMGYSLEADHGHMASSETITSKAFISPPTNVLSVATPMPVTHLKSQLPGHEQALASMVFHLNHNVIGQSFQRSLTGNAVPSRFLGKSQPWGRTSPYLSPNRTRA